MGWRLVTKAALLVNLQVWQQLVSFERKPLTSKDRHADVMFNPRGLAMLMAGARLVQAVLLLLAVLLPQSLLWTPWRPQDVVVAIMGNLGGGLRFWSMETLGHMFTFRVGIRTDHRLVTGGPYQFVRHPSYTGAVLLYSSTLYSLGVVPLWLVACLTVPTVYILSLRIRNEEQVLLEHFGEQYKQYSKRVQWRMFPLVY